MRSPRKGCRRCAPRIVRRHAIFARRAAAGRRRFSSTASYIAKPQLRRRAPAVLLPRRPFTHAPHLHIILNKKRTPSTPRILRANSASAPSAAVFGLKSKYITKFVYYRRDRGAAVGKSDRVCRALPPPPTIPPHSLQISSACAMYDLRRREAASPLYPRIVPRRTHFARCAALLGRRIVRRRDLFPRPWGGGPLHCRPSITAMHLRAVPDNKRPRAFDGAQTARKISRDTRRPSIRARRRVSNVISRVGGA